MNGVVGSRNFSFERGTRLGTRYTYLVHKDGQHLATLRPRLYQQGWVLVGLNDQPIIDRSGGTPRQIWIRTIDSFQQTLEHYESLIPSLEELERRTTQAAQLAASARRLEAMRDAAPGMLQQLEALTTELRRRGLACKPGDIVGTDLDVLVYQAEATVAKLRSTP